jgi:hypothetical protein
MEKCHFIYKMWSPVKNERETSLAYIYFSISVTSRLHRAMKLCTIGTWILKKLSHLQARIDKVMPLRNNCWACLLTVKPKKKRDRKKECQLHDNFNLRDLLKSMSQQRCSSSEHLIFSNIIYLLRSLDGGISDEEMMWNILRKCSISTRKRV